MRGQGIFLWHGFGLEFPIHLADSIEEEWFGWQPMSPNSVPIIYRSPTRDNVPIAAGHNMLGVSMSPATGNLVAELLSDATSHVDDGRYTFSRFAHRQR